MNIEIAMVTEEVPMTRGSLVKATKKALKLLPLKGTSTGTEDGTAADSTAEKPKAAETAVVTASADLGLHTQSHHP